MTFDIIICKHHTEEDDGLELKFASGITAKHIHVYCGLGINICHGKECKHFESIPVR